MDHVGELYRHQSSILLLLAMGKLRIAMQIKLDEYARLMLKLHTGPSSCTNNADHVLAMRPADKALVSTFHDLHLDRSLPRLILHRIRLYIPVQDHRGRDRDCRKTHPT